MKHYFVFTLILFFYSIIVFAQEKNDTTYYFSKNHVLNLWDTTSLQTKTFTDDLRTAKTTWFNKQANQYTESWETVNEYNTSGQTTKQSNYNYSQAGEREYNWQYLYEYNQYGQLTLYLKQEGDSIPETWVNTSKEESFYNSAYQRTTLIKSFWNTQTYEWEASEKDSTVYDTTGALSQIINYEKDNETNLWIPQTKQTLYLNSNPTEIVIQSYIDNTWQNVLKNQIFYDCNGKVSDGNSLLWNNESQEWQNNSRYIYNYNATGERTVELHMLWSDTAYVYSYRFMNEYENGRMIVRELQYFTSEQWEPDIKYIYTYNENNQKIHDITLRMNHNTQEWESFDKKEHFYEENLKTIQINYEQDSIVPDAWQEKSKYLFIYNNYANGLQSLVKEENFLPTILISGNTYLIKTTNNCIVNIYSITGQTVYQTNVSNKITIPQLNTGYYLIQLDNKVQKVYIH